MDIGGTPISLPSLTKINEELQQIVRQNLLQQKREMLTDIAKSYGLPQNELYTKYLNSSDLTVRNSSSHATSRQKKDVSDTDRCIARISTGEQCRRRHKEGEPYCGSHCLSHPFGVWESQNEDNSDIVTGDETEIEELPASRTQPMKIMVSLKSSVKLLPNHTDNPCGSCSNQTT